jgi:hypothetical protein
VQAGVVELPVGIENTQVIDSAISPIAPFAWFASSVSPICHEYHTPKLRPSLECHHILPYDLAGGLKDPF